MEKISYKLDVFEGPMDLLLHLISKHKLNIYDLHVITKAVLLNVSTQYLKPFFLSLKRPTDFIGPTAI